MYAVETNKTILFIWYALVNFENLSKTKKKELGGEINFYKCV